MVRTRFFPKFKEELPRVDKKVFVITGTTSGTGFVAAQTAAELGGEVVVLNRKSQRAVDSLAKLKEAVPDGKFMWIECDLQDFSSVNKAIAEIKTKYDSIYCLSNNAGIAATPDEATVDGYDTQMQTNHLSHFLLTAELYPLLAKYAEQHGDARIVNHSSVGRTYTPNKKLERKYLEKNGGNLGGNSLTFVPMGGACLHRYFQTKLANSVFSHGLHNELQEKKSNVRVICAHPGGSETNLNHDMDKFQWYEKLVFNMMVSLMFQTAEDGAAGLIYGMMHPDAKSGELYGPKNDGMRGWPEPTGTKQYETDPEAISMLFATSEAATGVKFDI